MPAIRDIRKQVHESYREQLIAAHDACARAKTKGRNIVVLGIAFAALQLWMALLTGNALAMRACWVVASVVITAAFGVAHIVRAKGMSHLALLEEERDSTMTGLILLKAYGHDLDEEEAQ